jgi:methyl-accepting chemotaxis protein
LLGLRFSSQQLNGVPQENKMKWFYDLKVSQKLISAFAMVIILAAGTSAFAIAQLAQLKKASNDTSENWLPSVQTLSHIALAMARTRSSELQHILTPDPKMAEESAKNGERYVTQINQERKKYLTMISEPLEKELFPGVSQALDIWQEEHRKIIELSAAGKKEEALALQRGESIKTYRSAMEGMEKLIEVNEKGSEISHQFTDETYTNARIWIIALMSLSIILSVVLAMWIARSISRPLGDALKVARGIADGDLSMSIHAESKDETGLLMNALKHMNDNLHKIVSEVRVGTDTITTASREIAAGNLDLSSRTEQQAGSLEETAAAMEELTSTVKNNADNAQQANQLAASASQVAVQGGDVVGQVVNTMAAINTSSKRIVEIISVIDGIAFQTNILALNAAVEAARAGEQGRGFAVVASEVRNLAQRSAAAAKEIKGLIDDSVTKVDDGSKLVELAGSTMKEVVDSVRRVTDIVSEITASSKEQSSGIEQINQAVTQMDEVTQQNAALVEQAAAAAQSLQDQAEKLSETVGVFKLDNNQIAASDRPRQKNVINITPRKPILAASRSAGKPAPQKRIAASAATDGGSWEQF